MESLKMRSNIKKPKSNADKKKLLGQKLTERESITVQDLKNLYLETIKLDVELQQDIYNLEKSYEEKHNKIFEQREKIIKEIKNSASADVAETKNISNFWCKVLKASYTEFISKKDEQILAHLTDIRSKLHNEPSVRFVLEFYFEPNEYFSNRVLTKTYFLNCLPDMEKPFTYDGAEIFKCEGCKIDWKPSQRDKDNEGKKDKGPRGPNSFGSNEIGSLYSSFFEFFDPPEMPENAEDPAFYHINAILQNDFELGFYLKERVIPKAILFFTGEIADCQSSDSDSDDDDDDDDDDEDDEEEDEDEEGEEDVSSANSPDE